MMNPAGDEGLSVAQVEERKTLYEKSMSLSQQSNTWVKMAEQGTVFPFHWQDLIIPFSPSLSEVTFWTSKHGKVEYHIMEKSDL